MNMPIENYIRKHIQYTMRYQLHVTLFVRYLQFILLDPHQPNLVHNERESRVMRTEMDLIK